MIVRQCCDFDIVRCTEIWKKSFPQDMDFADIYFNGIHRNDCSFVCEYEGVVSGYLSAIPFKADVYGEKVDCRYYYGICVDPDMRGRGIMREMLQKSLSKYNCFSVLIPAITGLYERFGFTYMTEKTRILLSGSGADGRECEDINHINMIYDKFRAGFDISLERSEYWWKIILTEIKREGFSVIANDGAYAVKKGNKVLELAYVSEFYKKSLPLENCELILPQSMSRGSKNSGNNYLALMLD